MKKPNKEIFGDMWDFTKILLKLLFLECRRFLAKIVKCLIEKLEIKVLLKFIWIQPINKLHFESQMLSQTDMSNSRKICSQIVICRWILRILLFDLTNPSMDRSRPISRNLWRQELLLSLYFSWLLP